MIVSLFVSFLLITQIVAEILDNSATFDHLRLDRYDINERPHQNREAVQVNVSIFAQDLEWKNNEMYMVMFFTQRWNDERLVFNGDNIVLVKTNQLKNRIWTPDTFIVEAVYKEITEPGTIKVFPNGNIHLSQMIKIRIPCTLVFDDAFENDGIVNCSMDMESYGFTTKGITYDWSDRDPVAISSDAMAKPFATCTFFEKSVKTIELPSGTYGRLSVAFKFSTVFTKQVFRYLGTKAMDTNV